jgi:hypothetical protein
MACATGLLCAEVAAAPVGRLRVVAKISGMDLSALSDLLANAGVLAKEMGKGGGGSTEEPTVCISLLPIALGVVFVALQELRRRFASKRL